MKSVFPLLAAAALPAQPFAAHAGVIFHDGFEFPAVTGRTSKAAGGDPARPDSAHPASTPAWSRCEDHPRLGSEGGGIVAGLTEGCARTGRQALFVEAARLDAPFLGALLVTRPIAVEGGGLYRACLWGLNDPGRPLTGGGARLLLSIQVDFFAGDGRTEAGESRYFLQPLPGAAGRPPVLVSSQWQPVAIRFAAPPQARLMVVSLRCHACTENGAVTGAVCWDDFTVETAAAGETEAGETGPREGASGAGSAP